LVGNNVGKAGPDGGVDLRLAKSGDITLVQYKHWNRDQVGVNIVRELMGVVASEKANRGKVVTAGSFIEDARTFAESVTVQLIDGPMLVELIRSVQNSPSLPVQGNAKANSQSNPLFPKCGSVMQTRTAK